MNLRALAVLVAVAFAIAAPVLQATLHLGLSQREFAADGAATLRAAGYAFSIWGLIYAGLIAYAVWQALPANRDRPLMAAVGWPAAVAITGCGAWIFASAADAKWLSVGIIVCSAVSLTVGLWRAPRPARSDTRDRLLVAWPLGLLAGWLTIASAINILTVLTAKGAITPDSAIPAALCGVAVVGALALLVLNRTGLTAFGLPIAWGLVAVWVAETQKSAVAMTALLIAIVVAAYAVWTLGRRRGR